jgi:NTE family protein
VSIEGKTYVDGGVLERVPVQILRERDCDFILAVDVGYRGSELEKPKHVVDVLMHVLDMMEWQAMQTRMSDADLVITPPLRQVNPTTLQGWQDTVQRGRLETLNHIDSLCQSLRSIGVQLRVLEQPMRQITPGSGGLT